MSYYPYNGSMKDTWDYIHDTDRCWCSSNGECAYCLKMAEEETDD